MDINEVDDFKPPIMDLTCEEEQMIDDDLDYALSYCLETEFEEDPIPDNILKKSIWPELKDASITDSSASSQLWNSGYKKNKAKDQLDADYMLALQLQKEVTDEGSSDHSLHGIPHGASHSSLVQNGKRFKAEDRQGSDYMLALKLQEQFAQESKAESVKQVKPRGVRGQSSKGDKLPASVVDPEWEVLDPIPDIHSLFLQFNCEFFWGALEGVEVRWSSRMTLCAGVCCYEGRGGLCSVRLSQPLLKYRPRRDLVETLLHEMIHAYLFVTHNNKDHNAHGPEFLKHMHRINKQTGARISVYHSFHDEVDLHRKHWWKCNGPCQHRSPFFGLVKRATNRAPSPNDLWWSQHQATCGGTFIKIKQPESTAQKNSSKRKTDEVSGAKPGIGDIRNFFSNSSPSDKENQRSNNRESLLRQPAVPNIHTMSSDKSTKDVSSMSNVVPFSGKGFVLGSSVLGSKGTATGSYLRHNSSTRSELLGDKVTKVSPLGVNIPAQRKDTKNAQSPMQKKPPLPIQFVKKHPGSVNMSSKKTGTALKFSSASGSKTIVLPKNSKTPQQKATVENPNNLPAVPFKGKGVILGGSSKSIKEDSNQTVVLPSTSSIKKRDSFDYVFPNAPGKMGNMKFKKVGLPSVKKKISSTQTKINKYAISPEGKNSISVKSESGSAVNSSVPMHDVKCPVCGSMVKDFAINAHLDTCLK